MGRLPFHDRHALRAYWMWPLHRKRTSNDYVCRIGPVDKAIVSRRLDAPRLHRLIIIIQFINWPILGILRRYLLHRISRCPGHVAEVESLRPDFPLLLDVSRLRPRSLLDIPHPGSQSHDTDNLPPSPSPVHEPSKVCGTHKNHTRCYCHTARAGRVLPPTQCDLSHRFFYPHS